MISTTSGRGRKSGLLTETANTIDWSSSVNGSQPCRRIWTISRRSFGCQPIRGFNASISRSMFALEEIDEENGCVRYVPGSHKHGMREHARTQTLGFSQGIVDYPTDEDRASEVALPAKPGDLLVHHAMTIHRADGNQSETRSRRALGFIYYSERACEDVMAHAAYQHKLAKQMKANGKI